MNLNKLIFTLAFFPLTVQAAVDIQRWTTTEGTQILLVERHQNPVIDMEISFKGAGSVSNPDKKGQVAEFTAMLLTDGTQTLDEEAFNEKTNDIASNIGSDSAQESASLAFRSLSQADHIRQTLALANESLRAPRFDVAVFERRQKQAVTALQQQETTPDFTAERAFTKLAYPTHPYGKGAYVTADSLKAVTLDDIRAFHRSHYGKDNAVVAIVGDVGRHQAEKMVQAVLKGLPAKSTVIHNIPTVEKQTAQRLDIPFAGEQAQIIMGMPLIKRNDPDYYALVAGNYILGGGGFDSRLMKVLRDQKGYTYGVYSSLAPMSEAGLFRIAYSTQKKNTQASLADAQAVIETFIAEGPTEAELQQAKANIIGSFPLRFDSNSKLLNYLSLIGINQLKSSYLEDYPKAIQQLTVKQVKEAWQRRVKFRDLHIVVVGAQ